MFNTRITQLISKHGLLFKDKTGEEILDQIAPRVMYHGGLWDSGRFDDLTQSFDIFDVLTEEQKQKVIPLFLEIAKEATLKLSQLNFVSRLARGDSDVPVEHLFLDRMLKAIYLFFVKADAKNLYATEVSEFVKLFCSYIKNILNNVESINDLETRETHYTMEFQLWEGGDRGDHYKAPRFTPVRAALVEAVYDLRSRFSREELQQIVQDIEDYGFRQLAPHYRRMLQELSQ